MKELRKGTYGVLFSCVKKNGGEILKVSAAIDTVIAAGAPEKALITIGARKKIEILTNR